MDYEMWQKEISYQMFWERLLEIILEKRWFFRYKAVWDDDIDIQKWETRLFLPAECYIDTATYGPARKWEVDWLEIDPIIETEDKSDIIDDTEYICTKLKTEGIEFEITKQGHIRIYTSLASENYRQFKKNFRSDNDG